MPGASRIVFDTIGPVRIDKASVLDPTSSGAAQLVLDLVSVSRETFQKNAASAPGEVEAAKQRAASPRISEVDSDWRPIIVLDPGHGGLDPGALADTGQREKTLALDFALLLRDLLEQAGNYRVLMTRSNDTFVQLAERVKFARASNASLFISVHCDSTERQGGEAGGTTIYMVSNQASSAEAEQLAQAENRVLPGVDLSDEPTEVADIIFDLARRENLTFSKRFARTLISALNGTTRLRDPSVRSAGFKVLKAPDFPSVLIELGYLSNPHDLQNMASPDWRLRTGSAIVQAVNTFFAARLRRRASE